MRRCLLMLSVLFSNYCYSSNLVIELPNGERSQLSFEYISSLPSKSVETHLPWISGESTFIGVSLESLILSYHNEGIPRKINVRALNDYAVDIKGEDIVTYQPILAYLKDGLRMKIRDKGPYWLIYSLKDNPTIDNSNYHSQMVWQIETIKIIDND